MSAQAAQFIATPRGNLAYRQSVGDASQTGIVWLGGFHSDMQGEKAAGLHAAAESSGRSYLRFDYSGHGESDGSFANGTITHWRADALAVIDELTQGPLLLVGSSMGGWLALLAALARPERVVGLLLLAPAPDFTQRLMWARSGETERRQIMDDGSWTRPSPYDEVGYPITRELIEDGAQWCILDAPIAFDGPVRIVHGGLDTDVPADHSRLLVGQLTTPDVSWTLVKDGDHRLSRPQDIVRLNREALMLAAQLDSASA